VDAPQRPGARESGTGTEIAPAISPESSSKRLLPWLVAVAFFMESLDTTILNTAVPAVSDALNVAPLSMKSVLASYTLSLAVFIPISGWMADRFGTRRVFASAIGLFSLGSCLCGISSNIHLLVAVAHRAGLRRRHDGAGGSTDAGTHVRQIRADRGHELRGHSCPGWPDARADRRRPDRRLSALAGDLLREYSDRARRFADGLSASAGLSRTGAAGRSIFSA
jgi:hypothetical protein